VNGGGLADLVGYGKLGLGTGREPDGWTQIATVKSEGGRGRTGEELGFTRRHGQGERLAVAIRGRKQWWDRKGAASRK
jgi:hypothetical protein